MAKLGFFEKLGNWRHWPGAVKYFASAPRILWYAIRSGSPWFFTASNPTITFGGFEGEGKKEMYSQLPEGSYPHTIYTDPTEHINDLYSRVKEEGFSYPFIVKPDVGMMGYMFRKIYNEPQLALYHEAIGVPYLVQELIPYSIEVAAFYYRMPDSDTGTVSGMLQKEPPSITGDGNKPIKQLIEEHPNIHLNKEKIFKKFEDSSHQVLAFGEKMQLSNASNRMQGGKFTPLNDQIDEQVTAFFDRISMHSGKFYYGRFDVMCRSLEDLKDGKNYAILEFNGAGAGQQHMYAGKVSFAEVRKIVAHHISMMYKIAKMARKQGAKRWGFMEGLKHLSWAKSNIELMRKKDREFPVF